MEDDTLRIDQQSSWQLLLQYGLLGDSASAQQSIQRITEAVGALGLQTADVDRIGKAVMCALRQRAQRETRDQHHTPVSIRIWVSDVMRGDLLRSGPDPLEVDPGMRRGWGFFLVEKEEGGLQGSAGGSHYLIELYLYQERGHAERATIGNRASRSGDDGQGHCETQSGVEGTGKGKEKR